jgi:hypothetical protein
MEGTEGEGETQFQTFIEVPAILDKYKAAAAVSDGKNSILNTGGQNMET